MDGYANRNCYIYNTVQTFRVIELFDFKSYFSNQGWFSSRCYITRQPECGSACFQECSLDRGISNNSNSWNCVIYYMSDAVCFTNMSLFNPQDNPLDKYCYHKLRPGGRWHIWGHLRLEGPGAGTQADMAPESLWLVTDSCACWIWCDFDTCILMYKDTYISASV